MNNLSLLSQKQSNPPTQARDPRYLHLLSFIHSFIHSTTSYQPYTTASMQFMITPCFTTRANSFFSTNFPSHLHLIYCSTDMYLSAIKCTHINKLNNTISSHFFTSQHAVTGSNQTSSLIFTFIY